MYVFVVYKVQVKKEKQKKKIKRRLFKKINQIILCSFYTLACSLSESREFFRWDEIDSLMCGGNGPS